MPAYSFQERFVPMVLDGSKPHTIRKRRKKGFAKKGDTLYLYFGLRTKYCRKLREEKCTDVRTIIISNNILNQEPVIILFNRRLEEHEFEITVSNEISLKTNAKKESYFLNAADQIAWKDGFRPEGSTLESPKDARLLFYRWWKQTHELPFIGDIIYWDPKEAI